MPLPEVLRTRLFEPLGMTDTGFWTAETDRLATVEAEQVERRAPVQLRSLG